MKPSSGQINKIASLLGEHHVEADVRRIAKAMKLPVGTVGFTDGATNAWFELLPKATAAQWEKLLEIVAVEHAALVPEIRAVLEAPPSIDEPSPPRPPPPLQSRAIEIGIVRAGGERHYPGHQLLRVPRRPLQMCVRASRLPEDEGRSIRVQPTLHKGRRVRLHGQELEPRSLVGADDTWSTTFDVPRRSWRTHCVECVLLSETDQTVGKSSAVLVGCVLGWFSLCFVTVAAIASVAILWQVISLAGVSVAALALLSPIVVFLLAPIIQVAFRNRSIPVFGLRDIPERALPAAVVLALVAATPAVTCVAVRNASPAGAEVDDETLAPGATKILSSGDEVALRTRLCVGEQRRGWSPSRWWTLVIPEVVIRGASEVWKPFPAKPEIEVNLRCRPPPKSERVPYEDRELVIPYGWTGEAPTEAPPARAVGTAPLRYVTASATRALIAETNSAGALTCETNGVVWTLDVELAADELDAVWPDGTRSSWTRAAGSAGLARWCVPISAADTRGMTLLLTHADLPAPATATAGVVHVRARVRDDAASRRWPLPWRAQELTWTPPGASPLRCADTADKQRLWTVRTLDVVGPMTDVPASRTVTGGTLIAELGFVGQVAHTCVSVADVDPRVYVTSRIEVLLAEASVVIDEKARPFRCRAAQENWAFCYFTDQYREVGCCDAAPSGCAVVRGHADHQPTLEERTGRSCDAVWKCTSQPARCKRQ